MEFFLSGNKLEVNDGQHGWAVVEFEGVRMFVNAMVVCKETANYCDILAVGEAVTRYIKEVQRKITVNEVYETLIKYFGGAKVVCEAIEDKYYSNKEECVGFYNKLNGKYLGGYSVRGSFKGELESTLELKAYDNNIKVSDIEVKYEMR